MEFFRIHKDIPFMKHALIFNVISALTFVAAVFFLVQRGLHLSIEFTGGTVMEVSYDKAANLAQIRHQVEALGFGESQVASFGKAQDVLIKVKSSKDVGNNKVADQIFGKLCQLEGGTIQKIKETTAKSEIVEKTGCAKPDGVQPLKLKQVEFVGPQVGDELTRDGINALLMVIVGVTAYLAVRFEWKFAVAAIIANLHDVVIIMGFFAFFQWEFSLTVLAAVLAVLGYSVNESVVIFDRIRENFRKQRKMTVHEVIDNAITSTISRTIITHGSTQIMVLSMLFLGGPTLHYFALALTIGICFGIYSSVFVAAAVAMWLGVTREDLIKPVKERDDTDGAVV